MGQFALSKLVSYLLVIFVVIILIVLFLAQMGWVKNPLTSWIESQKEDLEGIQGDSGAMDSALLKSRTSALEIKRNLDISVSGVCRVNQTMTELLGNAKTSDYTYSITLTDNELIFVYVDPLQGMSFNASPSNIKRVYVIQDTDNALKTYNVSHLLGKVESYKGTEKMATLRTNEDWFGTDYELKPEVGTSLLMYEDGEIEFDMESAENFDMRYLWRTPFRVNDALVFIEGDIGALKTGWEESEKIDEINAIKQCGG